MKYCSLSGFKIVLGFKHLNLKRKNILSIRSLLHFSREEMALCFQQA